MQSHFCKKILTKNKFPSMEALGHVLVWKQIKNCNSRVLRCARNVLKDLRQTYPFGFEYKSEYKKHKNMTHKESPLILSPSSIHVVPPSLALWPWVQSITREKGDQGWNEKKCLNQRKRKNCKTSVKSNILRALLTMIWRRTKYYPDI